MGWHMVDPGSIIYRDGLQSRRVEGCFAWAASFGSAAETVRLKLTCGRTLPVKVHGPGRQLWSIVVPAEAVQARKFLGHRVVAEWQGREVRDEDALQLNVCIESHTVDQVCNEVLVGVVAQTPCDVRQV